MRAALLSLPFLAWLVVHWCLTLHIALPPARAPEDLRRSLVVLPAGSVAASQHIDQSSLIKPGGSKHKSYANPAQSRATLRHALAPPFLFSTLLYT